MVTLKLYWAEQSWGRALRHEGSQPHPEIWVQEAQDGIRNPLFNSKFNMSHLFYRLCWLAVRVKGLRDS